MSNIIDDYNKAKTEYNKAKESLRSIVSVHASKIVKHKLDELKNTPFEILAVKWSQYTPYFNDGEPCIFGVNDLRVLIDGIPKDAGDYEDGWIDIWDMTRLNVGKPEEIDDLKLIFKSVCDGDEDLFYDAFGDHAEIIYNFKKFEINSYEHE